MNKAISKHNLFNTIFCALIFIWICAIHIQALKIDGYQIHFDKAKYIPCNEGWYDDEGNEVDISKVKFTRSDLGKQHNYHFYISELFDIGEDDSLCFFSRGLDLRAYVTIPGGRRKVYDYYQNGAGLAGKDIGLELQTVPIHKTDKKHEVTFIITPTETTAFIMDMKLQNTSSFIRETIHSRLGMLIKSLFIFFYGFVVIVYTMFAVRKKREEKSELYAWGAFSICIGILTGIQSQVFQFLTGKPEFFNAVKYILSVIMVFPQAVQVDSSSKHPHKHFSFVIGIIVTIVVLIETLSIIFFGVSRYRLFLMTSLPLLLFNFVMTVLYFIKDLQYRKINPEAIYSVYPLGALAILCAFTSLDLVLYVRAGRRMLAWGDLMRDSYIVFVFVMLIVLLRLSINRSKQLKMTEIYKTQARTDALTGLFNKGAFITREAELALKLHNTQEEGKEDYSFVIMSLDLNNLKKVNDNLGHEAGDKYIKTASKILKEAVGSYGETYRVGGDEFLILIVGENPEENYFKIIETLEKKILAYNEAEKKDIPLSMAYGHATCSSKEEGCSIHDSERLADQEMYDCKKRMKVTRE